MPAMLMLGARRKLSGYPGATQGLHKGFIFSSEIVQVALHLWAFFMLSQRASLHPQYCASWNVCSPAPNEACAAQGTPPAYKKKASRPFGGTCMLLARIAAYGQDSTGAAGASMKVLHMQGPGLQYSCNQEYVCGSQVWRLLSANMSTTDTLRKVLRLERL